MKSLLFHAVVAAVAGVCSASPLQAQGQTQYPNQPLKFIVPNPAGGLPDTIARIVGRRLQERLGHPVVIENRSGASASIGTAALTSAPADGHTFLVTDGAILSVNPVLYRKLSYNPKDVLPVASLARAPIFLAAHPKVPVATLTELIQYAKAHPGKLTYGSSGIGSFHHLSMEAIKAALDLRVTHVPFRGSAESIAALLGGHVDLAFSSYASLSAGVEGKQLKLLATNGATRSPQAPDAPAIAETIPAFDFSVLQGIYARAGTPDEVVQKIAAEVATILKKPDVVRQFDAAGIEAAPGGPEDFARALAGEVERVSAVVHAAGIKAE